MKAYIAVSYTHRQKLDEIIAAITNTLLQQQITPFVFVDEFTFNVTEERLMMQQAITAIDNCSFFIAETSYKAIGIGVEAGYAKAKGKPVIYLRHAAAAHSTTVCGISDYSIIYKDAADLAQQLKPVICSMPQ